MPFNCRYAIGAKLDNLLGETGLVRSLSADADLNQMIAVDPLVCYGLSTWDKLVSWECLL